MTDAQLRIILDLILTKLNNGITMLESSLPEEFKIRIKGTNNVFDPDRTEIPTMNHFYELQSDLLDAITELEKSIDSQK